eukprot:1161955-Pelagomonas_calceolata.AAC.4
MRSSGTNMSGMKFCSANEMVMGCSDTDMCKTKICSSWERAQAFSFCMSHHSARTALTASTQHSPGLNLYVPHHAAYTATATPHLPSRTALTALTQQSPGLQPLHASSLSTHSTDSTDAAKPRPSTFVCLITQHAQH